MAGSISLSLSQQFDSLGNPLNGGTLTFYAAGTTTPQSAYQDVALTIPWPNPIILDSAGRIPAFYLEDGQIKIRLADANGVVQVAADNLLVIGASSGSGSPPSVDATKIYQTGDLKPRYGTGAHTGWVRINGRTIGSGSSGASERANSDCQDLFEYLWTADVNLTVSTGRGASANADWVANKTIALPSAKGRDLRGLADMGDTASTILNGVTFNAPGTSTTLGSTGGASTRTLVTANFPPYTPTGTVGNPTVAALSGAQAIAAANGSVTYLAAATGATNAYAANQMGLVSSGAFTGTAQGGTSTALETISPTLLVTIYMKL